MWVKRMLEMRHLVSDLIISLNWNADHFTHRNVLTIVSLVKVSGTKDLELPIVN